MVDEPLLNKTNMCPSSSTRCLFSDSINKNWQRIFLSGVRDDLLPVGLNEALQGVASMTRKKFVKTDTSTMHPD